MKKNFRLISRLDIKNNFLVKGVQMEGWRKLGSPNDFAYKYYIEGLDELFIMDIVASLYKKDVNKDFLNFLNKEVYIPVTYGGGIGTVNDACQILSNGADRVCVNTAAVKNPNLISQIAIEFGTQAICVAIDVCENQEGEYIIATEFGRNLHNIKVNDWIKEIVDRGAGEVIVTSIQKDGTLNGFDNFFLQNLYKDISVPLIVGGGFGEVKQLSNLFEIEKIDGVLVAAAFHQRQELIKKCKKYIFQNGYETRKI